MHGNRHGDALLEYNYICKFVSVCVGETSDALNTSN